MLEKIYLIFLDGFINLDTNKEADNNINCSLTNLPLPITLTVINRLIRRVQNWLYFSFFLDHFSS